MKFKKLALAAAVAALPATGFSMEAMEDSALSGVTGQDGINIGITTNDLELDVVVHDKDGLTGFNLAGDSGAIVIQDMAIRTNGDSIDIAIDADGNGAAPVLNVAVTLPDGIEIDTGDISVAQSDRENGTWGYTAQTGTILQNSTITLGETNMNIQLGNEAQGSMIVLDTVITGGISITDGGILDATAVPTTPGEDVGILFDSLLLADSGGTDLTVDASVDVENDGLVISLNQFGDATNGADLFIVNQRLGAESTAAIGDIEIQGLNLNGTSITIAGK